MADLPKLAKVGDVIECDMHFPYPRVHRELLATPEACAFGNELLMNPASGWRLSSTPGVVAAEAWQHEEDPARVISAAQKTKAERDGGASASSVKPYSIPLVKCAAGAQPSATTPDTSCRQRNEAGQCGCPWGQCAVASGVQPHVVDQRNRGLLQAAKQALSALDRHASLPWGQPGYPTPTPGADLLYEARNCLRPAIEREEAFRSAIGGVREAE